MTAVSRTRKSLLASVADTLAVDPIAVINAPAVPTLTAVRRLKPAIEWLEIAERQSRWMLTETDPIAGFLAEARLRVIPPLADLQAASQLFAKAVMVPAPSSWLHLALGAMLDAMPNASKVTALYRHTVIDLMENDDDCSEGFSAPVVVLALRELLRTRSFVPVPAEVLKACQREKIFFENQRQRIDQLLALRSNAEQVLAAEANEMEQWTKDFEGPPLPSSGKPIQKHDHVELPF